VHCGWVLTWRLIQSTKALTRLYTFSFGHKFKLTNSFCNFDSLARVASKMIPYPQLGADHYDQTVDTVGAGDSFVVLPANLDSQGLRV